MDDWGLYAYNHCSSARVCEGDVGLSPPLFFDIKKNKIFFANADFFCKQKLLARVPRLRDPISIFFLCCIMIFILHRNIYIYIYILRRNICMCVCVCVCVCVYIYIYIYTVVL